METAAGAVPPIAARAPEVDEREFRRTMGRFCTGVTVVTALDEEPVGFTCQSFTSLSLDPPLVMVSSSNRGRSLPRIVRAGSFGSNILSARQEAMGRRFATSRPDKFAGVSWQASPVTGTPRINDALAWIDSVVRDVIPGGDHTILIGQVVAVHHTPDAGEPLLFFDGEFCDLAAGQPGRGR
ncbi:flavin reductase family protein [Micromonospora sp. WMMA1998]|uniref:flavin reductase family protein n=1 Tax=unclassified Micromonospora TaxID=2617518 RepID=UPI00248D2687|nr:flavin reductase family protein [Micromonospora sp. WMMA1998]WBC16748.1 flavin reductase family protein [Micromonospora sp. WMMA1998]